MAKYYGIRSDQAGFSTDVAAALTDYYGAGVTVHYAESGYAIFTCPQVSSKVIRLYHSYNHRYGDAWTSGSSITNAVQFCYSTGAATSCLVLGDSFIWGQYTARSGSLFLIGKTVGGSSLIFGSGSSNTKCINVTTGQDTKPILLGAAFKDGTTGRLYRQPVYFANFTGELLIDGSSYDYIPGIYAISHPRQTIALIRQSFLISEADGTAGSTSTNFSSHLIFPIYIEFDVDHSVPQAWNPDAPFA